MTNPTDEERREVAARLRELERQYGEEWGVVRCGELPAPVDDAMHACGIDRAVYGSEIFNRLADLIEPEPERTCRIYDTDHGFEDSLRCDACQMTFKRPWQPFKFCPNCGAKVVDE